MSFADLDFNHLIDAKARTGECSDDAFGDLQCEWFRCIRLAIIDLQESVSQLQLDVAAGGGGGESEIKGPVIEGDGNEFQIYDLQPTEVSPFGACFAGTSGNAVMCVRVSTNDSGGFNGSVTVNLQRTIFLLCDGLITDQEQVTVSGTTTVNMGSGSSRNVCATGAFEFGSIPVDPNNTCTYSISAGPVTGTASGLPLGNTSQDTLDDGEISACLVVQCAPQSVQNRITELSSRVDALTK